MPDLVKLVEVLQQRAPCHQQIQVDLTRHFHHHLHMVGAAFILESVHFSITPTEMFFFFSGGPITVPCYQSFGYDKTNRL